MAIMSKRLGGQLRRRTVSFLDGAFSHLWARWHAQHSLNVFLLSGRVPLCRCHSFHSASLIRHFSLLGTLACSRHSLIFLFSLDWLLFDGDTLLFFASLFRHSIGRARGHAHHSLSILLFDLEWFLLSRPTSLFRHPSSLGTWHPHHTPLIFSSLQTGFFSTGDTSTLGTLACSSHSLPPSFSVLFRFRRVGTLSTFTRLQTHSPPPGPPTLTIVSSIRRSIDHHSLS